MTKDVSCISPYSSKDSYDAAIKMAKAMAYSTFVPDAFRVRKNPEGAISNCLYLMELASAFGLPFAGLIQNVSIIHDKPYFSTQFLIGRLRNSGQFGPLKYIFRKDAQGRKIACHCEAVELASGEVIDGPEVTLEMAQRERWGSKWTTMPENMLRYRAAAFFVRLRAPDVIMGYGTIEEGEDANDVVVDETPQVQDATPKVQTVVDELNDLLIKPVEEEPAKSGNEPKQAEPAQK